MRRLVPLRAQYLRVTLAVLCVTVVLLISASERLNSGCCGTAPAAHLPYEDTISLMRTSVSNTNYLLDMWLHGQDFSEVRILIQHPWSVARANKNMSDPERKILDAWQQHSWIITEKGFDPTACELISDGHKHAQILHCPISKPVERGQTIEFSLTESVHNLEVYRNLSLRAPEAEFQPPSGVVAMCTSPLSGDKARYLPEWIEWHRMFGTEHFFVYDWNLDSNSLALLRHYQLQKLVTVIKWKLQDVPDKSGISMQPPAMNHCLHRFGGRFKVLQFWDTDEYIIVDPSGPTLPEFYLQSEKDTQPNIVAVRHGTYFFGPNVEWRKTGLVSLGFTERGNYTVWESSKLAIFTSRATTIGVHLVTDRSHGELRAPIELIQLNHYRASQRHRGHHPKYGTLVGDTRAHPFVLGVVDRLKKEFRDAYVWNHAIPWNRSRTLIPGQF